MKISGYTLKSRIGTGGQAMVYLAIQDSLQRRVALKVLNPLHSESPEFTTRFLNEGRILANLGHSNVITIHDIGVENGFHYLSMELVEGGDLKQRMREKIEPEMAVGYVRTIADCLATAHEKNIVHRDIKPANVLFRLDGTLLLTDFGIAKQLDEDSDLTATGTTVGSPHYLSPEQARGKGIDGRADIYSLGIMAYEMLTGEKPFVGDSNIDTIFKHINDPIPRLPGHLSAYQELIDRMTAKLPEDRFATARELVEFIDQMTVPRAVPAGTGKVSHKPVVKGSRGAKSPDTSGTRNDPKSARTASDVEREAATAINLDTVETEVNLDTVDTEMNLDTVETEVNLKTVETEIDPKMAKTEVNLKTAEIDVGSMAPGARRTGQRFLIPGVALSMIAAGGLAWLFFGRASPPPDTANKPVATRVSAAAAVHTESRAADGKTEPAITSTAEAQAEPAAGTPPREAAKTEVDTRVESLLASAERALAEFRLTTPEGDNALAYYEEVLALDPGNPVAAKADQIIAKRYGDLASSEIKRGNYAKARGFIDRGIALDPNSSELAALTSELDAAIAKDSAARESPSGSDEKGASSSNEIASSSSSGNQSEIKGESPRELLERVKGWFK